MPRPRNHVAGYVNGQLACVAGGREPSTSSAVDCLDTTTTSWRPGIPLPTPTSGAAAAIVNGVLTVAGGESSGETALVPLVQELGGISWSTEAMIDPRHGTGYANIRVGSGCVVVRRHPATTPPQPVRPSPPPRVRGSRQGSWASVGVGVRLYSMTTATTSATSSAVGATMVSIARSTTYGALPLTASGSLDRGEHHD